MTEKALGNRLFGTFGLGTTEIGIDVNEILEVVNAPEDVVPVPLSPPFMLGVFNLRGMIIPILDVGELLGIHADQEENRKVAILEDQGVRYGLVFDSTKEIVRVDDSALKSFSYEADDSEPVTPGRRVVAGVLRLDDGNRLVDVIHARRLARIENLPRIVDPKNPVSDKGGSPGGIRKQCITFQVEDHLLALEMTAVSEIIPMPDYQESSLADELCLGMTTLRGVVMPLLRLSKMLDGDRSDEDEGLDSKKVIVMHHGSDRFGLVVDEVTSILAYTDQQMLPIPDYNQEKESLVRGCIVPSDGSEVLLLDHGRILEDEGIVGVTQSHQALYQGESLVEVETRSTGSGERFSYITFSLGHRAALPVLDVREIIEFPESLTHTPGTPEHIRGVFNLRGKLVSVVDLRRTYGLEPFENEASTQVLIVDSGKDVFGFMVDRVDGLIHIDAHQKQNVPSMLRPPTNSELKCDIKEYVTAGDDGSFESTTMIFDLDSLVRRVRGDAGHTFSPSGEEASTADSVVMEFEDEPTTEESETALF